MLLLLLLFAAAALACHSQRCDATSMDFEDCQTSRPLTFIDMYGEPHTVGPDVPRTTMIRLLSGC